MIEGNESELWIVRGVNLSKLKHFYISFLDFNKRGYICNFYLYLSLLNGLPFSFLIYYHPSIKQRSKMHFTFF